MDSMMPIRFVSLEEYDDLISDPDNEWFSVENQGQFALGISDGTFICIPECQERQISTKH
jgi:hypothetical protein